MKLDHLYPVQGYSSKQGEDNGASFELALETSRKRVAALDPQDRTVKPARFLYAGESSFQLGETKHIAPLIREAGTSNAYALTDEALFQLAGRVGPRNGERVNFPGYLRTCPDSLRVLNMNHWMQANGGKEVFFRTVKPNGVPVARAFLSDRYVDVDDVDILSALSKTEAIDGAQMRWMNFSESSMMLRLTWKKDRREVKPGDVVEFGVQISNSEVGKRAIRVEPVVYRLICANGAIAGGVGGDGSWYIRHAGKQERVVEALNEAVRGTLPAARALAEKFSKAVHEVVDRPVERMKALALEETFTEAQLTAAVGEMLAEARGREVTRFDFVNGVTGAARQQENAESRYDLERLGAALLSRDLPLPVAQ